MNNQHLSDPDGSLGRFRRALSIPTVTPAGNSGEDTRHLKDFQDFLEASFPAFHAAAERHAASPFGVWYRLPASTASPPGKSAGPAATGPLTAAAAAASDAATSPRLPVLFLAHYDVVPVKPSAWTRDPFAGEVGQDPAVPGDAGTYLYGRGSLDTKNTLMALMEALEQLCLSAAPRNRDIFVALGGDEELEGTRGARIMAGEFGKLGLRFDFIHDEGGIVALDLLQGISRPMALVGMAEKGFCNLRLSVIQSAGHASRPPRQQAAARLGRALAKLESGVFADRLTDTVAGFLQRLAPVMGGAAAVMVGRPRLFAPLLFRILGKNPDTAAMFHTTLAITRLEGSQAANVMPDQVSAICNLRILPGETVDSVLARVRKRLKTFPEVMVELEPLSNAFNPVGESPLDHDGFDMVALSACESFPGCAVLPYLVTARTDSSFYAHLAGGVYRFAPMALDKTELALIHGNDERISLQNYRAGLDFYRRLVNRVAGLT